MPRNHMLRTCNQRISAGWIKIDTLDARRQLACVFRVIENQGFRARCDLCGTLFLVPPDSYEGGVLTVDDLFGTHDAKRPAGHLVLHDAASPVRLAPVIRGVRLVATFQVQSLVRSGADRRLLLEMDEAIQRLATERGGGDPAVVSLTGVYHNLLRRWTEC